MMQSIIFLQITSFFIFSEVVLCLYILVCNILVCINDPSLPILFYLKILSIAQIIVSNNRMVSKQKIEKGVEESGCHVI